MISNILVALSIKSNVYQVPLELVRRVDGDADCLAERPSFNVEIQQAEKTDVVNVTYSLQDDMTTRAEDKAHAKDSVHVDNPDTLEEVVGTKLEEQAEDGAEAGDTYNLVSNIEEEPTDVKAGPDSSTSKVDDGVDSGGDMSSLTNREDDEESLDERKRRSIIAQGKRREVPCEDEHPTRTKKNLRGISAIFGFTPTVPELLQRRESLTPVATDANRKHSPSRLLSGFRMPKLVGTSRSSMGFGNPLLAGTIQALKKVVFPLKLCSSAAAREKLPASEPAPTLMSPGEKGAGVWRNAMRALRLPKEVKEAKKGVGTSIANDAEVNLALLMPKAVSTQIYSRKR
ncbi:hypothetical protein D9615_008443 [Tricholomella constricta]|uniref:Uncharacterized protein n=1 Tax=Tricholomella constricta TaxID=117010 RepID=A0A8H5H3X3_9AGAR|nr:hypothetical protein D9615_008443 [Tricholomella constricta]